jgi:hypothetical protein
MRTITCCLLVLVTLLLLSAGSLYADSWPFLNPGFESGDATGWVTGGADYQIVTDWTGANGTHYTAPSGNYFLAFHTGSQATGPTFPPVWWITRNNLSLQVGDKISGWIAYAGGDAPGMGDYGDISYNGQSASQYKTVNAATYSYGSGPWEYWTWDITQAGTYQLGFDVGLCTDHVEGGSAWILFDMGQIGKDPVVPTPEPGSCALLLMGLAPFGAWFRRRRNS